MSPVCERAIEGHVCVRGKDHPGSHQCDCDTQWWTTDGVGDDRAALEAECQLLAVRVAWVAVARERDQSHAERVAAQLVAVIVRQERDRVLRADALQELADSWAGQEDGCANDLMAVLDNG